MERPHHPVCPPSWDLVKVLQYLLGLVFDPLHSKPLRVVTIKVAFLLALATAKRVGELQVISARLAFLGQDLSVSYLLEFVAKTESERNPLPRSFLVHSLLDFIRDLPEERVLCLVYLDLTEDLSPHPCALFVSLRRLLRSISLSFFILWVIVDAGASSGAHHSWCHCFGCVFA